MTILYQIVTGIYRLLIRTASLFNEKARLFVKGRKDWQNKLGGMLEKEARYIWVHCASLGEFEQGRPVIEKIRERLPEYKIVLTFFSPSGYEIRKNYPHADIVTYMPEDTKKNARKFIDLIQPEKVLFVKYEFWYFYLNELKNRKIPAYVISANFREDQLFFKNTPAGKWYRKMLFTLDHIFVQNENASRLLAGVGVTHFSVTGDTRFDRVAAIAAGSKILPVVDKFRGNSPVIIAGSTWKPDEELLSAYINSHPDIRFIIAPHEVSEANIHRITHMLKTPWMFYSRINNGIPEHIQTLVIDSVGLLSSLYRYGTVAYIGGGFGVGIHNILEAATFGLPVLFGPNYKKFREAVELSGLGGAFPISVYADMEKQFNSLLSDDKYRNAASTICRNYITKNVGATTLIIKKVFNMAD